MQKTQSLPHARGRQRPACELKKIGRSNETEVPVLTLAPAFETRRTSPAKCWIARMALSLLSLHTTGLELKHGLLDMLPIQDTPIMRTCNGLNMPARVVSPAAKAFRYFAAGVALHSCRRMTACCCELSIRPGGAGSRYKRAMQAGRNNIPCQSVSTTVLAGNL
jgi:hypothetical protein